MLVLAALAVHGGAAADTGTFTPPYERDSVGRSCTSVAGECRSDGAAAARTGALAAFAEVITDASGAAVGLAAVFASVGVAHELGGGAAIVRYTARLAVGRAAARASAVAGNLLSGVGGPGFLTRVAFAQLRLTASHERGNFLTGECADSALVYVVDSEGILAPTSIEGGAVEVSIELADCPPGRIDVDAELGGIADMADHGVARADVRDATLTRIGFSTD